MFEGFPIIHGREWSYRAYFVATPVLATAICSGLALSAWGATAALRGSSRSLLQPASPGVRVRATCLVICAYLICILVWVVMTLLAFGHSDWVGRIFGAAAAYGGLALLNVCSHRKCHQTRGIFDRFPSLARCSQRVPQILRNAFLLLLVAAVLPVYALGLIPAGVAFLLVAALLCTLAALVAGRLPVLKTTPRDHGAQERYMELAYVGSESSGGRTASSLAADVEARTPTMLGTMSRRRASPAQSHESLGTTPQAHGIRARARETGSRCLQFFCCSFHGRIQLCALVLAALLIGLTTDSCIGFFAPEVPGLHLGPIMINSAFTRALTGVPRCDWTRRRGICHTYLTLPENATDSIFIVAHAAQTIPSVSFLVCESSTLNTCGSWRRTLQSDEPATVDWLPEQVDRRRVFSALIEGLGPDKRYLVWVKPEGTSWSKNPDLQFTSLPADDEELTFVSGGDIGVTPEAARVGHAAVSADPPPRFAILGGDIAYANDLPACAHLWDAFFFGWARTWITSDGDSVPMVSVVGNHDAGSNAESHSNKYRYSSASGWEKNAPVPLMIAYFPHESVPLRRRHPYHRHDVGGATRITTLDSGHIVDYDDPAQLSFLHESVSSGPRCRMLVYHVPVYPAGGVPWESTLPRMTLPRKYWIPEFASGAVAIAFENHVHSLKITTPQEGVTYFGDGRWGISASSPGSVNANPEGQFVADRSINHVWLVQVSPAANAVNLTAIGGSGPLQGAQWHRRVRCRVPTRL